MFRALGAQKFWSAVDLSSFLAMGLPGESLLRSPTWNEIKAVKDDYTLSAPLLIRSALPGKSGCIDVSGDEDILRALGLNTVQESREPLRIASISDVHSGKSVASAIFPGDLLVGAVHAGIDVSITPAAGMRALWNDAQKDFLLVPDGVYTTTVHLADNTRMLQVGANEGENDVGEFRVVCVRVVAPPEMDENYSAGGSPIGRDGTSDGEAHGFGNR
jgi:hypothetical protein